MKRFYDQARAEETPEGWVIKLDDRIVKTPGKETLVLPSLALAQQLSDEWQAQGDKIDAEAMPLTRLANTATDRVLPRYDQVVAEITEFAATDLLCYRADDPPQLAARQAQLWDPYLAWAAEKFSAPLGTTTGIMPIAQPEASLAALDAEVRNFTPFALTALSEFTNGFGSLVLALAFVHEFASFDTIWQASVLDQSFQEEKWGEDSEIAEKRAILLAELGSARLFMACL